MLFEYPSGDQPYLGRALLDEQLLQQTHLIESLRDFGLVSHQQQIVVFKEGLPFAGHVFGDRSFNYRHGEALLLVEFEFLPFVRIQHFLQLVRLLNLFLEQSVAVEKLQGA